VKYLCDEARHLVCEPYSVENLHRMATALNIKECWFHKDHYDIPKRRIKEITAKCEVVSSRRIVEIIRGATRMSDNWQVKLDEHDERLAYFVGNTRHDEAVKQGRRDCHGLDTAEGKGRSMHILGACGELSLAKAMNVYWNGTVNTFKFGGDVGDVQVRTRSESWYDLLVRRDDKDEDRFVLVTGQFPVFNIKGWLFGRDAKREEWFQAHGGREKAYFVPKADLRPMWELYKAVTLENAKRRLTHG
jgi:hypothetical protein